MNPELSTDPRNVRRRERRARMRNYDAELAELAERLGPYARPVDAEDLIRTLPYSTIPEPSDAAAVLDYLRSIGWGPKDA